MQNAKFNPEQITYVTFFPTDNNPGTPTLFKEKVMVENPDQFILNFPHYLTDKPGLLLLEQKGKKRSFVQCFWLEPGEPVPVKEPTQEPSQEPNQEQNKHKDEMQEKKATTKPRSKQQQ